MDKDLVFWLQIAQLIIYIGTLGMAVGTFKTKLNQLEKKQDKYNNIQERMVKVEASTASSHHRLDDLVKVHKEHQEAIDTKLDKILESVTTHVEKFHTK